MLRNKTRSGLTRVAILLLLVSVVIIATNRKTSALPHSAWYFHGNHCHEGGERCLEWLVDGESQGPGQGGAFCCEGSVLDDFGGCSHLREPDHSSSSLPDP